MPKSAPAESDVPRYANGQVKFKGTYLDGEDHRREFRSYIRLARRLDSPGLRRALTSLAASPSERTARQARWMLDGVREQEPSPSPAGVRS